MAELHADLPELFDLDYGEFADDAPFYESFARRGDGPVLELGVGTGRAAVRLARAGVDVWGIDVSDAMLARATCNAGSQVVDGLHLRQGDMRDFTLDREFDLIFAGLGAFHHLLTPEDQAACLDSVRTHLAPGGVFICDLRPALLESWETGDSVPLFHEWTRVLQSTGETVIKMRAVRADPVDQVKHDTSIYDLASPDGGRRRIVSEVDLRFTTRYEMEGLLRGAGLERDQLYGDFDLSPYDEDSEYMITVASRARDRA